MLVRFQLSGRPWARSSAAYLSVGDDPRDELVAAVVQAISTDLEVRVGEVTMHLAAWMDPDHWADDWRAVGIDADDVDAMLAQAIVEDA